MAKSESMKVGPCVCVSAYQDRKLGKGNRFMNKAGIKNGGWRCTVCGNKGGK
jgi:hypothetical protein